MKLSELSLKGAKLITPQIFRDHRGFFLESYRETLCQHQGMPLFVQDNHSYSVKGVIRGMHFQSEPGQAKLIRVVVGKIYDVIVDIRPHSMTYGKWEGVYLDDKANEQLFIPVGFAHGFQVISDGAHVLYKVSAPFNPKTERSFRFDDPEIAIRWIKGDWVISERDSKAPFFQELQEAKR